jgi:uncharacterized delta-60 repeat protein
LAIQPDGKIVAVGHGGVNGTIGFALARYNPDGSLDSTFNGDGRVITHIGTGSSYGRSVALQADAKIVVAGYAYSGSNCSLALARYNSDGSLDATFDGDGTLLTSVGAGYDYGYSVAIQTDGKIVVAGQSDGSFLVIRYHPDGMLDTDFAGDGKVMVKVGSSSSARSLAIHDDGKIVVAGYTSNGSDDDFAMVRLDPTGGLDASFGNQGMLVTAFDSADDDWAFGLALQSDGRLVAAGLSGPKMALARYTATGTLDTSFGRDGKVTTSFGVAGSDRAHAVAIQPDGKIVAAGYAYNGRYLDFALSRYNSDGSPDTSFGVDGRLISGVFPSAWGIYAVATQPDGRILVAGDALGYFAIGRYESAGAVDTTFANDGIAMVWDSFTDFGSAEGIALQADGKIVVTGYADIGGPRGFAVVRLNPDGTLDTTFGASGTVTTPIGSLDDAHSVVIQADGKIVVAGYAYKDFNRAFALVRYNSDGSLDTTFDGDGKVTTPVGISSELYSLALQADGKIVAAGRAEIRGKPAEFALARFNPDGSLDTSFDGDGTARLQIGNEGSYAYAVAIQRDGKILVAGSARNGNWDFALVRLNPDGSLDTTFNDGGITFTPFGAGTDEARALAIQPDGKMVLAGYAYNEGQFDFALARYAGDGPATVGIPNVTVDEDAPDTVIDLFAAFADPTDPVSALTFTVPGNTDPSLFASLAVNPAAGTLTLNHATNAHGSAAITVRATDPVGWYVETAFTVSVHPPNGAPTISDIADQSVNRLETLTFTVSATDADLPANTLTYHLDDDSGAAGMTIDAATGRFTWTPGATQGGRSYTVTVIVTDDGTPPLSDSVTFSISVSGPVWQNPAHPCDVNGDGSVTPADVLPLINEINANGARDLTTGGPSTPAPPPFLDPTGDNYVSAADVLMVVNYINAWGSGAIPGPPAASALGGEGERADKAAVPFATASGLSPVARRDALNPVAGGRASPPDDWQRAVALVHAGRQSRERHGEFGLTKRERMERDDDDLAFWWAGVEDAVAAIARQAAADSLSSGARLGRGRR